MAVLPWLFAACAGAAVGALLLWLAVEALGRKLAGLRPYLLAGALGALGWLLLARLCLWGLA
ncbi:hypothetical protein [Oceanicella sp. SM1341]|uniref:hypothetical protein n=1 Tax=Oceanicella sp. SM1341 TaxID=1548889 RepID=UPI000E4C6130|nr:hypothetical protein [Oceanicella sp. SM1341]